ncbi:MAG: S8 family peptidase [Alphaproteobacteria bacterium]
MIRILILLLLTPIAFAADEKFAWQTPFELELPETTRTIILRRGADAATFVLENGLQNVRVVPMGRQVSMLETPLDEDSWRTLSDQVCNSRDVAACDSAVCQGIQLAGSATPGSEFRAEAVQARLVRNPPEDHEIPEETDGEAGTCRGTPLLLPLDQGATAGAGQNLSIDLSVIDGQSDPAKAAAATTTDGGVTAAEVESTSAEPIAVESSPSGDVAEVVEGVGEGEGEGEEGPARQQTADTTPGDFTLESAAPDADGGTDPKGFQFTLKSSLNPLGGVELGTDELPADTTDWTLVVGAGCTEVKVPLSAIEPARVPGIVVALVDAGNVAPVATTFNLVVVRQLALNSTGQNLVVYATAQNIFTVIAALASDPRVNGAQPEFIYLTTAEAAAPVSDLPSGIASGSGEATGEAGVAAGYSDPFAALNYGPAMTGALELHASAAGRGQLVAVIDTGVDVNHPDLAGRLREPVDTTGNGYAAEIHGTAVAGIIAAEADNAIGSFGVAPAAEILPIKACQPKEEGGLSARCTTSSLIKALDVAIMADATIINMSLAGPPDDLLSGFVSLALQQDRLIIAGAGNGGKHAKPGFPAALPGVLAVTAVDVADRLYSQANRGDYIDIAAPGVDIVSTAPNGRYPPLSGTSMAAAHVSGVAALIRELGPLMGSREVASVIRGNTRDLGEVGTDMEFGTGLVDACSAAAAATAEAVVCLKGEDNASVGTF